MYKHSTPSWQPTVEHPRGQGYSVGFCIGSVVVLTTILSISSLSLYFYATGTRLNWPYFWEQFRQLLHC